MPESLFPWQLPGVTMSDLFDGIPTSVEADGAMASQMDWQTAATRLAVLALCCPQFFNGGGEQSCDICRHSRAEHDERDVWRLKVFEQIEAPRLRACPR